MGGMEEAENTKWNIYVRLFQNYLKFRPNSVLSPMTSYQRSVNYIIKGKSYLLEIPFKNIYRQIVAHTTS